MSRAPKKELFDVQHNVRISRRMKARLDATAKRLQLRDASKLVRGGILLAVERPREALDAEARVNGSRIVRTSEEAAGNRGGLPAGAGRVAAQGAGDGAVNTNGPTSPSPRAPVPDAPVVHLPTVLSTWTGLPKSLARMALAQGRVTVAGEVPAGEDVPSPERGSVLLDGRPV